MKVVHGFDNSNAEKLMDLEENGVVRYEISYRGGYYKLTASQALELLDIDHDLRDDVENCLPEYIGCGCNYLGGGVRGAIFGSKDFEAHGVPKEVASQLDELVDAMKIRYQILEGSMNNEQDEDGETNWDAMATNMARNAGTLSAY